MSRLDTGGLLNNLDQIDFLPASEDDLALAHTRRHIAQIGRSGGKQLDPDTYSGDRTPAIARMAAGAALESTRLVARGAYRSAFCAIRPPGHHATADRAMGFCYFNNVAIAAARFLRENLGARALIVDWDVHHGNGTQAIFYESDRVMYSSVHQYPFYPGTGASNERGRGQGKGFTINKPLPAGAGDAQFLDAIAAILDETAAAMPTDIVFISAGFDAHRDDPLANLNVSVDGFVEASSRVRDFARQQCGGRIISVLEGGYNTQTLADCVAEHVRVLMD